jgi:hypothetical protein
MDFAMTSNLSGTLHNRFERLVAASLLTWLAGVCLPMPGLASDTAEKVGVPNASHPIPVTPTIQEKPRMWMSIGSQRFSVMLEENPAARAFSKMLPATFQMTELNGNEKFVRLPRSLPTNASRLGTLRLGDVVLYGDDTVVVFYETFQSNYSYTRLGRVVEVDGLAKALGTGNPRVSFANQ